MRIQNFIPETGKKLASYKGAQLIDRIGEDTVKEVVLNVLCGSNIRALTETLTRKRLALSNAALLMTYLDAGQSITNLQNNLSKLIGHELACTRLTKEEKQYLQWLVGLTGKSVQNVLRGGGEKELIEYLNALEDSLKECADDATQIFGDLTGTFCINDRITEVSWPVLTRIFTAIGAQTLAIRGSEKSMYGKLFEKFILGSMLSILGFSFSNQNIFTKDEMIFWLSERGSKRESDATILVRKGVGVRFDIGFIGPGNTEISLDKVSRFETEMQFGNQNHYMSTIIIVDRIGEGSRISDMAKDIGGHIVQMSMSYWVKSIAQILADTTGYTHPILKMSNEASLRYVKDEIKGIELRDFI